MLDMREVVEAGLAPDTATLTARMVACAEKLGFGLVSGVLIRGRFGSASAAHHAFANPPEGYFDAMNSAPDGQRDPLLAALMRAPGQVQYDQQLYTQAGAGDLWDAQASFGFRSGMAVSLLQGSHEEAFLLGIDGPDRLPTGSALLQVMGQLQLLAAYAQSALTRIVAAGHGARPTVPELNNAELQAIKTCGAAIYSRKGHLTAIGAEGTQALRSAAQKLGARSRADVVLKAIDGGLIHP